MEKFSQTENENIQTPDTDQKNKYVLLQTKYALGKEIQHAVQGLIADIDDPNAQFSKEFRKKYLSEKMNITALTEVLTEKFMQDTWKMSDFKSIEPQLLKQFPPQIIKKIKHIIRERMRNKRNTQKLFSEGADNIFANNVDFELKHTPTIVSVQGILTILMQRDDYSRYLKKDESLGMFQKRLRLNVPTKEEDTTITIPAIFVRMGINEYEILPEFAHRYDQLIYEEWQKFCEYYQLKYANKNSHPKEYAKFLEEFTQNFGSNPIEFAVNDADDISWDAQGAEELIGTIKHELTHAQYAFLYQIFYDEIAQIRYPKQIKRLFNNLYKSYLDFLADEVLAQRVDGEMEVSNVELDEYDEDEYDEDDEDEGDDDFFTTFHKDWEDDDDEDEDDDEEDEDDWEDDEDDDDEDVLEKHLKSSKKKNAIEIQTNREEFSNESWLTEISYNFPTDDKNDILVAIREKIGPEKFKKWNVEKLWDAMQKRFIKARDRFVLISRDLTDDEANFLKTEPGENWFRAYRWIQQYPKEIGRSYDKAKNKIDRIFDT